jgi:YesN/AraC family two-component response regulator
MSEDGGKQDFTPPATQEELNRIIDARLKREREKFADYDDLKARAKQLEDLEQSKKSAEEQLTERITALEAELGASRHDATRARIQAKYKVSDDDAELFLTASDADGLERQAKALADRAADRKAKGPVVPSQKGGEDDKNLKPDPLRAIAQQVFKQSDE